MPLTDAEAEIRDLDVAGESDATKNIRATLNRLQVTGRRWGEYSDALEAAFPRTVSAAVREACGE